MEHTKCMFHVCVEVIPENLALLSLVLLGHTNSYSVQMIPLVLARNTYLVHTFIDLASSMHLAS